MTRPPHRMHRLGARLVLVFLVLALVMALTFMTGLQRALGGGWRAMVRPLVADYVDRLAADIGSPPDVGRAMALVRRLPLAIRIEGPQVNWSSHPDGVPRLPPRVPMHRHPEWRERGSERGPPGAAWRGSGPEDDGEGRMDDSRDGFLLSRNTADGHRIWFGMGALPWRDQPRVIGWITLAGMLLVTAAAYGVVRHLLRPLAEIGAGAQRYGQGEFEQPIPVRRRDELGQLAGQINTMAGQLRGMLDAKRALLLAISHELRSPLTRARLNAELVDDGPARDALLRDLAQMRELIGDLLESERLAAGHAALLTEPTDLAALIRHTVSDLQEARAGAVPGGADEPAVELGLDETLGPVEVDPVRWRVLVRNLVENALRHGRAGTEAGDSAVMVTLQAQADELVLTVRDRGRGVDAEHLARLGEAFYRPDAARGRDTGGIGLGLHLCRLVAQAHGGRLELQAAKPGLAVVVRWPRRPAGRADPAQAGSG